MVRKYLGLDRIVSEIVEKLGDLQFAFITGDYAKGLDTGIIDLVLVGSVDEDRLKRLVKKAEELISRRIRYLVLDKPEYSKLKSKLNPDKALWLWGEE